MFRPPRRPPTPGVAALAALGVVFAATPAVASDITGKVNVPKCERAFVYVDAVPGTHAPTRAKMDQRNKVFLPFVLAVVKGGTVEFHNSDDMVHNVFGVGAEDFNLGDWTKGYVRDRVFNVPGEIAILCNIHPEMEAYVLVLQNPFFAQPDATCAYTIRNVPAGSYTLKLWYQSKLRTQKVVVPATGAVTAAF